MKALVKIDRFWYGVVAALLVSGPGFGLAQGSIASEVKELCKDLPFVMPEILVPSFPDHRESIADHGAIADGYTMNTIAIGKAIDACVKAGGGTVIVPPGVWLSGPIKLESNINLHLERGALLQFSRRIGDFPFIAGFDGKSKRFIITPPIHAYRAKNIAITGDGIIDGAGETWRYVKKDKQTDRQWKTLVASGGVVSPDGKEWWPSKEAMEGEEYLKQLEMSGKKLTAEDYAQTREYLRPDLVSLVQCNGILLDGTTFQNSPKFHIRPIQSEQVVIRNIKVLSPWHGQNNDGIDPASCRNVIIYNCTVDVGDDGICLKPGSIASSQTPGPACQNIVVSGCVVYHAHGGFVIGSESYGGVNNVSVRNCVFMGTDVGIRFKSLRGRGGLVENVFIDGIRMRAIEDEAVLFDMYYGGGSPDVESTKDLTVREAIPVNDLTPRFQNFFVKNVVCDGANRAVVINGLPELPIKNITLENVSVTSQQGVFCADAEGVRFNGCRIVPQSGPDMTFIQSRDVVVQGGAFPVSTNMFLKVEGEKSGNIKVQGIEKAKQAIEYGTNVPQGAVSHD